MSHSRTFFSTYIFKEKVFYRQKSSPPFKRAKVILKLPVLIGFNESVTFQGNPTICGMVDLNRIHIKEAPDCNSEHGSPQEDGELIILCFCDFYTDGERLQQRGVQRGEVERMWRKPTRETEIFRTIEILLTNCSGKWRGHSLEPDQSKLPRRFVSRKTTVKHRWTARWFILYNTLYKVDTLQVYCLKKIIIKNLATQENPDNNEVEYDMN